jgi:flagellar protein FlaJ
MSRQKQRIETRPKPQKIGGPSRLSKESIKLLRGPATALANHLPEIRQALLKSGQRSPPENYVATVLLLTICTIPVSIIGVLLLPILNTPLTLLLLPVPMFVFLGGLAKPWASFSTRSGAIDTELPYVISYFSILSLLVTLRRISRVKLFPTLSVESKRILTDIDMYGMDPVSALEKTARTTPNKYLSDFLSGYTALLRAGGRLTSYMDAKIHEIFNHRLQRARSASNTIGTFAEAYVAATVVMGLCFYLIFTLQSIITRTGPNGLSNAVLFSSVFIPIISAVFFFLVDAVQVKDGPTSPFKHIYLIFGSLVAVPIMMFLPIDLPLYIKMGIGLIVSSVPPMIKHEREARSIKAIENALPKFVRDIAEVRKTGLAPERCIQQVSEQNYGKLSKYIKDMSAQISWGIPIRRVMENFANTIQVWSAKAIAFVLLEVVDLGGGTARMFENMADFAQQMKEISREQKSNLRPLIFVPYVGSIMLVASTMLMMNFLIPSGGEVSADTTFTQSALLTGAVAQAWIMGFAAGKMGEGSMYAGFKHAIALAAVSMVTVLVVKLFVPGVG